MRQRLSEQWPFLATSIALVLMGLFVLTTRQPLAGWVFVGFGGGCVVLVLGRALMDAVRGSRE